jgi:hypothetical protein
MSFVGSTDPTSHLDDLISDQANPLSKLENYKIRKIFLIVIHSLP